MFRLWRLALCLSLLVSMFTAIPAGAASPDYQIANGHFYTQANGQGGAGGTGYGITNDGGIPFYNEFRRLGSVSALGYPASRRFTWDGFTVQVTQRAVLQWQPGRGLFFVNVFDRLHDLGKDAWLEATRATPPPFDTQPDSGLAWEQVKTRHWAFLDQSAAIKEAYWDDSDPLSRYGLPMSYKDYGNVFVVRAQRAVFQQWKEDVPWAKKGQVTIALGGDIAKELGIFPAEAITPEPGPQADSAPAVTQPQPSAPVAAPAGFGYGMQVDPSNDPGRAMAMIREAGFSWAKIQLRWEDLERDRGNVNWGFIDEMANLASSRGVNLLFSVVTAPRWSRPGGTDFNVPGPPANLQDFANFVGAIAARHKGKVKAYEIWNEQNLWYEWGGTGRRLNAGQYVDLLRRSYAAIKAADPNAIVVSGAPTPTGVNDGDIAYDDVQYLQMMYDAGLKNVSDAIGAHPSGFNNPPDDDSSRNSTQTTSFKGHGSFYFRRFEQLYDVMRRNGDGNKKLWFTEFGWASSPNPYPEYAYARDNDEGAQARYLVRAFEIAKAKGTVGAMFVWNLNFATNAEANDRYAKKAFAILNPDWGQRAAYRQLAAMPK
ncbi:MAG: hypothetical protein HY331_18645 [Chloroflexi bacterium]|nr:hypothetical protein [Chloroflexota bacterium]